jgi:signal transduction histidine kinase
VTTSEKKTALIELAGNVAHELNNIFTAVVGNLSLLKAEAPGPAAHAPIEDVLRAAHRGIVLSRKLQAFAGRQHLKRQPVDLNKLVERVASTIPRDAYPQIKIHLDLSSSAPIVLNDEERLAESVKELLDNAISAMPVGGTLEVETRLRTRGASGSASVMLAVTDTGMGIPAAIASQVFDPLFTTKASNANAGWGLPACEGFARQSGGYMTLSTKAGAGTRVEMHLPADAREVDAANCEGTRPCGLRLSSSTPEPVNGLLTTAHHD